MYKYYKELLIYSVQELEAIKARVREMEEEAEKLKQLQSEVDKQMNMGSPPGISKFFWEKNKIKRIKIGNLILSLGFSEPLEHVDRR